MINTADLNLMQLAYEQAELAVGVSSPNPRVGCVLAVNNKVVGKGYTQQVGQAHAEIMAIQDAKAHGFDLRACTVYATLEPCSHFGRTPPCVDALKMIKPERVVIACMDPNPQVSGRGVAALREMNIEVEILDASHALAQKAYDLNIGFMQRMTHAKVYTRLKWASSIDGKVALPDARSQWITGARAREDGHLFRARADIIVTGVGTILQDNPQMNVRVEAKEGQPIKCIIDTWLRTPLEARLFDDKSPVYLVCADVDDETQLQRMQIMQAKHEHATLIRMPLDGSHIDLKALWAYLYEQQINEVHLEAGPTLNTALLNADLVDELLIYLAPRIIGSGFLSTHFGSRTILDDLTQGAQWRWLDAQLIGEDMRLRAQKIRS